MAKVSAEDIRFLNENFKRFGTAWEGGLPDLERHFSIGIARKRKRFELQLEGRNAARMIYAITVQTPGGGMSHKESLPQGKSLTPAALTEVDGVLKDAEIMWLIGPANGDLLRFPLGQGVEGIRQHRQLYERGVDEGVPRTLESRLSGDLAVLYFVDQGWGGEVFFVAVDLRRRAIAQAGFEDLPPNQSRLLPPEEFAFLDDSLRRNGDFGVYGNLTAGLEALLGDCEVRLHEQEDAYSVAVMPIDGHGHHFHFAIDRQGGKIEGVSAGHSVPAPGLDELI